MISGIERLIDDLKSQGYLDVVVISDSSASYALLSNFIIPAGTFAGRVIDLAIPAPTDFPRSIGSSMHIKAKPAHLLPFGETNTKNIIKSGLGEEWQYWSYRFHLRPKNVTLELITQINEIFRTT